MNTKTTVTLYYLAAALFFVNAILKISDSGFTSGIVWLCLGSAFFCTATAFKNKQEAEDENASSDHTEASSSEENSSVKESASNEESSSVKEEISDK